MGPSGSGKTTLLDVLAGRKTTGTTSGVVRFAGYPPTSSFLRRYAGYVEQFDTLLSIFTAREMLMYTAELKVQHLFSYFSDQPTVCSLQRPVAEPFASKKAAVDAILQKLGLEECQNVRIGDPLRRGISGGQVTSSTILSAFSNTSRPF